MNAQSDNGPTTETRHKRRRITHDEPDNSSSERATLTTLPLEILAEVLLHTHSPPTVLAVSRTSSYLFRTLVLNPAASFIWRGVRKTCKPSPLPEPGDKWRGSEAQYAAFVFDAGVCEVCKKRVRAMYVSFATRLRLCSSVSVPRICLCIYLTGFLYLSITAERNSSRQSLFSLSLCTPFSKSALLTPSCRPISKPIDSESLIDVTANFQGQAPRVIWFPYVESTRCFCAFFLIEWKCAYEAMHKRYQRENESRANVLAAQEGWDIHDLMSSEAYGALHRRQTYMLENVGPEDVQPIRSIIESQLLEIQARRERRLAEANYEKKLRDTDKIYEKIRSGTQRTIVPPLATFRKLSSVCVLKGRPNPTSASSQIANISITADPESSQLATSLITSDIQAWLVPVRNHLMGLLGFPDGWRSASKLKVGPLERVSAKFLCGRCADGGVGWKHRTEECLDFRAVCAHVCTTAKRGGAEKPHVEGGAEVNSADARTAIALVNRVLSVFDLSDDDSYTADLVSIVGGWIRCLSCTGWIVMDFETAVSSLSPIFQRISENALTDRSFTSTRLHADCALAN
ncbi:hypothetical protein F5I97DRAFT_1807945 [Phlebopus sp. FC_14]|nr:hypothetical protein F5I97DRAFT_1807945 [Phlebopus sp. FC_14]